jgi:ATP-dependent RNA helicase DDX3X
MAEQLNMGGLSINESQHAPSNGFPDRAAYIPPHLRGRSGTPSGPMDAPPPVMNGAPPINGNMNGGAWGGPPGYVSRSELSVLALN